MRRGRRPPQRTARRRTGRPHRSTTDPTVSYPTRAGSPPLGATPDANHDGATNLRYLRPRQLRCAGLGRARSADLCGASPMCRSRALDDTRPATRWRLGDSRHTTAPVQCSVITPERLLASASYRELGGAAVGSVRCSRVSVNLAAKRAGDACVWLMHVSTAPPTTRPDARFMTESQPMILALSFEDLYRSEYPGLIAVRDGVVGSRRRRPGARRHGEGPDQLGAGGPPGAPRWLVPSSTGESLSESMASATNAGGVPRASATRGAVDAGPFAGGLGVLVGGA